jgi:outer membrane protein OmpA-like peptidoglycan-associated protein
MRRFSRIIFPSLVAVIMLSACTTFDPYTGDQQTAKATKGAIGGAIVGALLGALTNTSDSEQTRKNALLGAGIGALAGAGVGNYMDQQEAQLRTRLEGSGVSVSRSGDNIVLNMPGNVTFDTDSDAISSGFYDVLNSVAIVLNEFDQTYVDVLGHTDSTGSDEHNNALSQRRANSVADYLAMQNVVDERFVVRGYGERMPIASNETPDGRQQNRRVEIQIAPYIG